MTITSKEFNRRDLIRRGAAVTALGGAAMAFPGAAFANGRDDDDDDDHGHHHDRDDLAQVALIHKLESTFHEARSKQDLDLLMTLWAPDAVFTFAGIAHSGLDEIREFFRLSPSFTGGARMAFSPTFKSTVAIHGKYAEIYFECHDVELTGPNAGAMVTHLGLSGTVRKSRRHGWEFWRNQSESVPLAVV